MPPLLMTEEEFNGKHRDLDRRLQAFSLTKRGRGSVTPRIKGHMRAKSALSLKAINCAARIRFAASLVDHVVQPTAISQASRIFFVTVILDDHAVPFNRAAEFDVKTVREVTRQYLDGLNYIGIVEAAYYYNALFNPGPRQPFVSWHSHAIVWDVSVKELAERRMRFNQTHCAFVPGRSAAHHHKITPDQLPSYARYLSKSALKEYDAYPMMRTEIDRETGEIFKVPTGRWRNRKRDIRSTNLLRALTAMDGRSLKNLCFGGGTGEVLCKSVLKAARRALKQDDDDRTALRRRLLYGRATIRGEPL